MNINLNFIFRGKFSVKRKRNTSIYTKKKKKTSKNGNYIVKTNDDFIIFIRIESQIGGINICVMSVVNLNK